MQGGCASPCGMAASVAKNSFGAETGLPDLGEGWIFLGASSSFGAETGTGTARHSRKLPLAKELLLHLAFLSFRF